MDIITDTKNRFHGISAVHRICYLRVLALRRHVAATEAPLVDYLIGSGSGDLYNPMNNLSDMVGAFRSPSLAELAGAKFALGLIEASPVFREAERLMVPALAQIDDDNRLIAERAAAEAEARRAAAEAEERATAKALAAVEKDPTVRAAREKLAALAGPAAELASDELDIGRELQADLH
jgi:hypothetical protein